ncbi:MAG: MBL fold metallo-hydrolase [Actinomycetota bacterium]|nr:MBL fold metallo-hydrolase [Actinomycetota bacterium]
MATPERVASGVYRVDAIGLASAISVLLIEDRDGWTLIDTGIGSSAGRIRKALVALGRGPEDLRRVFLTHHHADHVGGLPGVREWAPNAELATSEREAEVISGGRRPDPPSNALLRYASRYQKLPTTPIDSIAREGDVVAGFRVVLTPGHTSGHASLLRDEDGLLFTGDAFGVLLRRIRVGVYKAPCTDPPLAKRSAERLLAEEFGAVVMSHGKPLYTDTQRQLREAVARCDYA